MTLRPEAVRERLRQLRVVIRNLLEIAAVDRGRFVADFHHHWLAERGLHLAAEAMFDVGNHVLAGALNVHATDYEDVIRHLGEQGVISSELRARLRGLGGFRNVLVHGYLEIDVGRVYEYLTTRLDDFAKFAQEVEAWLVRRERDTPS